MAQRFDGTSFDPIHEAVGPGRPDEPIVRTGPAAVGGRMTAGVPDPWKP